MRKILATAATLGLASFGAIVPAANAQASTACNNAYAAIPAGTFVAYSGANCGATRLGSTTSWDSDWGNSSGPFQGRWQDTNNAESLVYKSSDARRVQLFNGTGDDWAGGHTCIRPDEYYMDTLEEQYFTSGVEVENEISSHRFIWSGCGAFLDS
ncbi:hypothetical protein [Streptomyces albicerus]|jgi:hypothetical protein|uniref:hypothetical protein n=1 Tax=Streptomyces albicerus TaxID=2569859 RepID=UPI00124AEA70|nr:hypothetical protein [Streptomyces albicerus]